VKTFGSRIATAAVIVVVAVVGWVGLDRYKDSRATDTKLPTDGSINGNVYTNNFFQFTLQFPTGWRVLSKAGSGPKVNAEGSFAYLLLLVGSADSQMRGTRWISISAAHPPASSAPLSVNVEDIAKLESGSTISVAGRRMARLDTTGQVNVQGKDHGFVSSKLTIIERGYIVDFHFTDPKGQESDREAARKAIDSMHFFGKTN